MNNDAVTVAQPIILGKNLDIKQLEKIIIVETMQELMSYYLWKWQPSILITM